MPLRNRLIEQLKSGKPAIGIFQMLGGSAISRLHAYAGYDWVLIDCEHGNIADSEMHDCIHSIAPITTPLVRIPGGDPVHIKRALDAGAHGIVVPLISTAEQARAVVRASKFPPQGNRGYGSPFSMASFGITDGGEYLSQANESTLIIVQIETREGLQNVKEIANVDGVSMLFVGPFDLSNSLGCPLTQGETRPLTEAIETIRKAAKAAGKYAGFYATSGSAANKRAEQGFDLVSVGADATALAQLMKSEVLAARGEKTFQENKPSY